MEANSVTQALHEYLREIERGNSEPTARRRCLESCRQSGVQIEEACNGLVRWLSLRRTLPESAARALVLSELPAISVLLKEVFAEQLLAKSIDDFDGGVTPQSVREDLFKHHADLAADVASEFDGYTAQAATRIDGRQTSGSSSPRCVPERIGNYRIAREIDRGGQAVVYEAYENISERPVAVKLYLAAADSSVRQARECYFLAQCEHPNIIASLGNGVDDKQPYIVLERAVSSLKTWIDDSKRMTDDKHRAGSMPEPQLSPLTPAVAFSLVRQIACGLDYIHNHKLVILHRDLKPSNILVRKNKSVAITDFGIAIALSSEEEITPAHANARGAWPYLAPELRENVYALSSGRPKRSQATKQTDLFALGAIFYQLLTGKPPPFPDKPAEGLLRGTDEHPSALATSSASFRQDEKPLEHEEPPTPRQVNRHVDADLSAMCMRLLEPDVKKRYVTAQALLEDFARYQDDFPLDSRTRTTPSTEKLTKWFWRKRVAIALSVLTVMCLFFLGTLNIRERSRYSLLRAEKDRADRQVEIANELREQEEATATNLRDTLFHAATAEPQIRLAPHLDEFRRRTLDRAAQVFLNEVEEHPTDLHVLDQAIDVVSAQARVLGEFGQRNAAAKQFQRVDEMCDRLVQLLPSADSKSTMVLVRQAAALREWGDLERFRDAPKADACYQRAIGLLIDLKGLNFPPPDCEKYLAASYLSRGIALLDGGNLEAAEPVLTEALNRFQTLTTSDPNREHLCNLAKARYHVGRLRFRQREYQDAEQVWRKSIADLKGLAEVPNSGNEEAVILNQTRMNLAISLRKVSPNAERRYESIQLLSAAQEGLAFNATQAPLRRETRLNMAQACLNYANARWEEGNRNVDALAPARLLLQGAIEQLSVAELDALELKTRGSAKVMLGLTYVDTREPILGAEEMSKATEDLEASVKLNPKFAPWLQDLRSAYWYLARLRLAAGEHVEPARLAGVLDDARFGISGNMKSINVLMRCAQQAEKSASLNRVERQAAVESYAARVKELVSTTETMVSGDAASEELLSFELSLCPLPMLRNLPLAETLAARATKATPTNPENWRTAAMASFRQADWEKLEGDLKMALVAAKVPDERSNPWDSLLSAILARAHGEMTLAAAAYRKGTELAKDYPGRDFYLAELIEELKASFPSDNPATANP